MKDIARELNVSVITVSKALRGNTDISDATRGAVKYGNTLGIPLLLVLYGIVRWRMREARRAAVSI